MVNNNTDYSDVFSTKLIERNLLLFLLPFSSFSIKITIPDRNRAHGIYLRELEEVSQPSQFNVTIQPKFFKDKEVDVNEKKLALELRVLLHATEGWIQVPEFLLLNNGGNEYMAKKINSLIYEYYFFIKYAKSMIL